MPSDTVVTVNADMKVGALEESVTVSGQSPQVDVLQASRTQVLTRDTIDALPVSRNVMSIGVLVAGVRAGTPDIGGSRMTEQVALRAHGLSGNDAEQLVEGMSIQSLEGPSQSYFDDMLQSEITVMTSAIPADTSGGGIRLNSVLKDGGNMFSGAAFLGFSSGDWQADNVDDDLRAAPRSIRSANGIKHIQMFSASFGGPIKRNKLWFLVTGRHQSSDELVADVPAQIVAPDGEVINSYIDTYVRGPSVRLTWQATPNHKIAAFASRWWKRKGKDFTAGTDPRIGQFRDPARAHHFVGNVKWSWTPRSSFLVEAGYSMAAFDWLGGPADGVLKVRGTPEWYTQTRKTDTQRQIHPQCAYDTGCTAWGSLLSQRQDNTRNVYDARVSYVTGTHNIKVGYTHEIGPDYRMDNEYNGDIQLNYNAGRPSTVTVFNTPLNAPGKVEYDAAIFAQDSWTFRRLTLNPGLRVEWFAAGMLETSAAAGRFAPARFFPAQHGLIKWGPDYVYTAGTNLTYYLTGRAAIEGELTIGFGLAQDVYFNKAQVLHVQLPNVWSYSGNVVFFPGGATSKRLPVYVTGGVGAVSLQSRTPTGQFGYDVNTVGFETFIAENIGGGLKIFRGSDAPDWGFRIDYRYLIVNANGAAPAFFSKAKNRGGHRFFFGVLFTAKR